MNELRLLPAGSHHLIVELPGLGETMAMFRSLQEAPRPEIAEIVPAARTLLLRLAPGHEWDTAGLAADLRDRDLAAKAQGTGELVEVPVLYDGEDLDEIARIAGLPRAEVIDRHAAGDYTVAFTGFAPGFGYMTGVDPRLQVPRRASPRTRIPAGAVALAGEFAGIYPRPSPGGWQILGRTPLLMFDPAREPPTLLRAGTRVRFRPIEASEFATLSQAPASRDSAGDTASSAAIAVRAAPLPAYLQDGGRPGFAGQGVSPAGALDQASLREANRLVGNRPGEACLEIAGGGFSFAVEGPSVAAVAGAPANLSVVGADGSRFTVPAGQATAIERGDRVTIEAPRRGARSYLAVRGGFGAEPFLQSLATDTLAGTGPAPIQAGTRLALANRASGAVGAPSEAPRDPLPAPGDLVWLDVVLGPRAEWFTERGLARLLDQEWRVTPRSSRVGLRIEAAEPLERIDPAAELPSEGTVRGSIQVPHDGQPVLFLADHPLTGGYPVIAVIAGHHLDLAGQVPIGARIRFRALGPLAEQAPQPEDRHP